MKKRDLIIYYVVTGLFTAQLLMGAVMYFFMYDMVAEMFTHLGVPTAIIYPLAVAKILGLIAIWFIKSNVLKTMAYAGFALDLLMAIGAHFKAGDNVIGPVIPLVLVIVSYAYYRKISKAQA